MAEETVVLYPQDRPLIMGEDDGSAPRLVVAQAYGLGWRKGEVGWTAGTEVDDAIFHHIIAPVATAEPIFVAVPEPVVEAIVEMIVEPEANEIPEPFPEGVLPEPDVPEIQRVDEQEPTYDLDAEPEPAKRGPGRPRKLQV